MGTEGMLFDEDEVGSVLVVPCNDLSRACGFQTVKEAQVFCDTVLMYDTHFSIFTLYERGERKSIDWKIQADTAANLREIKKVGAANDGIRRGRWTDTEQEIAVNSFRDGMLIREIADRLKRSYQSTYCKLSALGEIDVTTKEK